MVEKLHKIVDGEKVFLNEAEESAIRSEWAFNESEKIKKEAAIQAEIDAARPITLTDEEKARSEVMDRILTLEALITPRRLRDAIIAWDRTFIESIETQISELRNKL